MSRHTTRQFQRSNVGEFDEVVEAAKEAFGTDPAYAIAVMRSANSTVSKRLTFEIKTDLERAEADAHRRCEAVPKFFCRAKAPCGTGDCRFAEGEMAQITVKDSRGLAFRPQLHSLGSYSLEDAVIPLRELRMRKERSRLEHSEPGELD